MGRLVRSPKVPDLDLQIAGLEGVLQSGIAGLQAAKVEASDSYLERMVKYVPAEVLAFLMVINAILDQAMKSGGEHAAMAGIPVPVIATVTLLIAGILTPLFCWYVRQEGDAWIVNAVVSTIALPFWAYLMGAVAFANFHDGSLAAILVLSFTVISGLVAPMPEKVKLRAQAAEPVPEPAPEATADRPRLFDVLAG
jgi:heme/copper-type cytochrome/quinol oxidase subunit 3